MGGMSDYATAARMRDIIRRVVQQEIESLRPAPRYAIVVSLDRANRKCEVQFPGETERAIITMGSVQPDAIGQTVRVAGIVGDRYIEDVMGPSFGQASPAYGSRTYGSERYG